MDEEKDFGGWVEMAQSGGGETAGVADLGSVAFSSRMESGSLRRKAEVFDQDDDLDLETICVQCGGSYFLPQQSILRL